MGESENISKISSKVSSELFSPFGWRMFGGVNFNFPCMETDKHRKSGMHPCDIVFGYRDPYSPRDVYFLTDLKSYSRETLKDKGNLRAAVENLSQSVACAWKSLEFQKRFEEGSWDLHGLLYVFNHDGKFDADFCQHLFEANKRDLGLPMRSRLFVLGPEDIQFHYDILNDLERELGKANVQGALRFFYPNQIERIPLLNHYKTATIELLKGPYLTVLVDNLPAGRKKAWLYYRGSGDSHNEFEYLLDYCFRYSLVDDATDLQFRLPYPSDHYQQNFEKAKGSFVQHFYATDGAFSKIHQISVERVLQTNVVYTEFEIGMQARKEFADGKAK